MASSHTVNASHNNMDIEVIHRFQLFRWNFKRQIIVVELLFLFSLTIQAIPIWRARLPADFTAMRGTTQINKSMYVPVCISFDCYGQLLKD